MIHLGVPHSFVYLLPQDINIDPNANGLPGIGQLRSIVGASMTIGLILAVLGPDRLRRRLGARGELVQPAPRWARQGRGSRRPRRRDHHRRLGDSRELLLERRPVGLIPGDHERTARWVTFATYPSSPTSATSAGDAAGTLVTAPFDWLAESHGQRREVDVRGGVEGLRLHHDASTSPAASTPRSTTSSSASRYSSCSASSCSRSSAA